MKALSLLAGAAGLLALAVPASAQERRGQTISVGGGAQYRPEYPGADSYEVGFLPFFDIRGTGDPLTFEAPDEGIGFGIIGEDDGFSVGPAINLQGKRREEDVGAAVGDVGFTVETGAFAQMFVSPNLRLRVEGRKGLGGHKGWVGDVGADFVARDRDTNVFSIGPRLRLSDGRYQRAYFGVDPATSAATGLPAFDPGGGIHAVGAVTGLTRMISPRWGVHAYVGYDRLVGDAADSPIVRGFGSRDQFSVGAALFFSFEIGDLFGR